VDPRRRRDPHLHRVLDPNAYLQPHFDEKLVEAGPSGAGTVGHVHLQVGDLATARAFYMDALGFETTQTGYEGALFASAGGYHHHVAMNVWNSRGAGPRAAALGLADVAMTVPAASDLEVLAARLRARAVPYASDGRTVSLEDPWGTRVTVSLPDLSTEELLAR
jgi:catechol 2,3-dioxygenase